MALSCIYVCSYVCTVCTKTYIHMIMILITLHLYFFIILEYMYGAIK